jgi:hypothetical protein
MSEFDTLLQRAMPILRNDARSLIECCFTLQVTGTDFVPVAGTCEPDDVADIEERLQLIRDIERAIGKKWIGPQWFDEMIFYGLAGRPV